ncbi:hypothetical protein [Streptomyces soliscabiei]|uniref:hypothetical protein n=1 Tax=Streptomyces soliscabiei TaxID=588897 RepID=UPI0029A05D7B|nr:hypothetical protein [Streptomyces sp. NY05-11A]MDX2681106.1 hypothetical protein [Streptomyces sp. NY05-11A]
MSRVRMTHPDLPAQPIEVDEASVAGHQAAGWQVAEDLPKPKAAAKRRRQIPKGDES